MKVDLDVQSAVEYLCARRGISMPDFVGNATEAELVAAFPILYEKFCELAENLDDAEERLKKSQDDIFWQTQELSARNEEFEAYAQLLQRKSEEIDAQRRILAETNERLELEQHEKNRAVASDRSKSAFLSMMSHEIRTPMNGVIGMTSLLANTELTPEQHEYVNTIRVSGDTLLTVINDILDYSKIESGKLMLECNDFELAKPIEEALELLTTAASKKQIDLLYSFESEVPSFVNGDITRIRQILVNLIGNAVKFTDEGEILVTVRKLQTHPEKVAELELSVRDTGIGIGEEDIPKLFNDFSQVDSSTSRKYGGTGLGLAICKRLVEMMGGRIRAESRPGEGSTFIFTLQLPIADQKPRRYLDNHVPELNDLSLLIVDDNHTNLRIMEKLTKSWGMHPELAGSGEKALEILGRTTAFDLIILDWHMPGMNGLELAEEIRTRFPDCSAPLIMLSSAEGGLKTKKEISGFTAYLRKPVKQSDLFDSLISTVTQRSVRRTVPQGPVLDPEFASLHPLRILIAEDNTVNQKLAINLLEKLGYRPDLAGNGLEVLDLLGIERGLVTEASFKFDYDLILMDCQMPEMDGYEATGFIRQWEADSDHHCVIVALTANAMAGDRKRCLEAGMDNYLSKPLVPEKLVAALRKVSKRVNTGGGLRDVGNRS